MDGPLRRLRTRRAATAEELPPDTSAASEPVDGTATHPTTELGDAPLAGGPGESAVAEDPEARARAAREEELRRRARDLPAGVDIAELERGQEDDSPRRGAVRRRARYLRRVRELLLRDLGGFFYEVHRTAGGHQHGGHRDILETKAARLATIDAELRELDATLGEQHPAGTVIREPGVGGTCPACGELHSSDARYCSHCATPLSERARRDLDRTIAERARAVEAAAAPAPQPPAAPPAGASDPAARDAPTTQLPSNGAEQEPVASERTP